MMVPHCEYRERRRIILLSPIHESDRLHEKMVHVRERRNQYGSRLACA